MTVIFRGCRRRVTRQTEGDVWLEPSAAGTGIQVRHDDPDLILDPTADDLALADAFERGEISAFEYHDGHTYPPGLEIRGSSPAEKRFQPH